jgi:hypothetical protein
MAKPRDTGSDKPRIDKLGVKDGARVYLDGVFDAAFTVELAQRGARTVRKIADADLVFVALEDPPALGKLGALRGQLRDDAAVWAVWPKGRPVLKEDHIRAAAMAERLVDVKVMKFSESHSGLKLVVPVAQRAASKPAKPSKKRAARAKPR